jgi:radical SAM PhpK family P-methyltransferase
MDSRLDCIVIGYNDPPLSYHQHRIMSGSPDSPERRVFMREHLMINDQRLACMDVINHYESRVQGPGRPYYHVGEVPNLAAVYLTSYLRSRGFEAEAVSLFRPEMDRIADLLESRRPRAVAITTTFYLMPWPVHEISQFITDRSPDTTVVVGGPLIDNLVFDLTPAALEEIFDWMGGDVYVKESQGEATLLRVLSALRKEEPLSGIPNVYVRDKGTFRFTHARIENNDLNETAIDWDLFGDAELGNTVQTRTARSCAFKCSFCDFPVRAGRLNVASVATVERELRKLARRGVEHVVFIDDTFNVPIPRFKDLCRMMIENDFGFRWYSFFRCSAAKDPEIYKLMAASGCQAVFLGVESGDGDVLGNMVKTSTVDQYRRGIEQLHNNGIKTFASFICGFPGETEHSVQNTIDFINVNQPTFFRAELWFYNHRSPIHHEAEKFQISGQGYEWQHATMDVYQASDALDELFRQATGSIWMPGYNYDFWAVPYLRGKGLTMDQIKQFHILVRRLMKFNSSPSDARAGGEQMHDLAELEAFFGQVRLARPRYQSATTPANDQSEGPSYA